MESTTSHDAGTKTISGGRFSISSLKRGTSLRVIISLIAVWLASSFMKPAPQNTDAFFPGLGDDIPTDKKYGLSSTKLALVFDPEHHPHSAYHLLHTVSTLPADWPLLYVGTHKSIVSLNTSYAIKVAQEKGRLTLQPAPAWLTLAGEETLQRLFARQEFYNSLPSEVEHLFISGMDSIMCSAATTTMDDLLEYDWVGSAWSGNTWTGGLGGYSLRRVSKVREALRTQSSLAPITDDAELMEAMSSRKKAALPLQDIADYFVMEDDWVERPMAYHPRTSLLREPGWDKQGYRSGIWNHCPELKIILDMKLERERCTPAQLEEMAKELAMGGKKPLNRPPKLGNPALKPIDEVEPAVSELTPAETDAEVPASSSAPSGDDDDDYLSSEVVPVASKDAAVSAKAGANLTAEADEPAAANASAAGQTAAAAEKGAAGVKTKASYDYGRK